MKKQNIISLYNQHERIGINLAGYSKFEDKRLVRLVTEKNRGSLISYFELSERNANAAIQNEIKYFQSLNRSFEWKVYDFDSPADITEKLVAQGFEKEESESFMVLDLSNIPSNTNIYIDTNLNRQVMEVKSMQGIKDAINVQQQVWGRDLSEQLEYLIHYKKTQPDLITIYVVYDHDAPVSSGWITYNDQSPFAGIWGGSTIEKHRGKGYYSELLHQRIIDAKTRGIRYLTIDASDMSKPIVEKYGFKKIAVTTPFTYNVEQVENQPVPER